MAVLTSQQRSILEKAVVKARNTAEEGAVNSLKNLAVDQPVPFMHQSREQRTLRNNLRAKARLLGDIKLPNGSHEIQNLAYELAYEYWHKILFARFLEANNLLMHPTMGVAVTLEEMEELASEEGYADKWEAAATYASNMLPAIFRVNDPLMQITFAPNDRIALESIINALEPEIFTADDALGWVYQFWQSEAKAAINASGDKIDGKRLPAVTQLFTEPYMVNFLIDNTLGAWWVSRNPGVTPPYRFEYLRTLEDGTPAAGKFEGWPDKTAEVTSLDPCMGSGHFVCSLFNVFAALRMHEEGLTKEQATDRVIAENLHGLEIDPRCTQIAAFNLALTAWKYCGHYKELPEMNLACSGIAPKGKVEDWVKLVGDVENENDKYPLENGMRALYDHFQLSPELGSLLDPTTIKADAFTASFDQLQPVLKKALENERDNEVLERGVMAAGIAKAGEILSKKYWLQITNVPYLGKGKFDDLLYNYVSRHHADAKGDLATVFVERLIKTASKGGIICSVMPHNWLFLTTYKKYRENLLKTQSFDFVVRLGEHAFDNSEAAGAFACLFSMSNKIPKLEHDLWGINAYNNRGEKPIYASEKAELIKSTELKTVNQKEQLGNPDARVVIDNINSKLPQLSAYCDSYQGLKIKDRLRLIFHFWENPIMDKFKYIQSSFDAEIKYYTGNYSIINWEDFSINYKTIGGNYKWNGSWGHKGITSSPMASIPTTLYTGCIFDGNLATIIPKSVQNLIALWCYCSSKEFRAELKKIDQNLAISTAALVKIPFDLEYWQKVASEKYPNGLPKPYSDDPTQWLFHGHPVKAENALQVALARLLGYRWPAESDEKMELSEEARELIKQVKELQLPFDEDGIVCITPVYSEQPAAERLRQLLQKTWGENWNNTVLAELLKQAGSKKNNLEDWLRDEFFSQHCKVFKNRPFIWHIWDGRKDGFSALVNYHKLDKETLKKLIYTYLGDWIRQCEAKLKSGESGADGLLSAALKLKEKLELILGGEQPYDIFVRWKVLEEQPIGWDPDLNDGVRLNIRPFVEAGLLRSRFNIKWGIDRGKNPAGSPWGEIRDNDRHLSLEEKRKVRQK
ncbi:MAG: BREX-1 system adenine-specific DNA-methyltransferase PglX [Synergistaceae bacterium]|jgi:hypothetical protein|nr:BREX-1 system adenine-specific DNA-methyltransferase PglX [Synergistaceae bacterium]